MRRRSHQWV
jgi:hypothetical protein